METRESQASSEAPPTVAPAPVVPTPAAAVEVAKPPEPPPPGRIRAIDVVRHAEDWMGRELVVEIYEPIRDARYSSAAPTNGFDVDVEDVGTAILNLVPDGKLGKLPATLKPPFRVRATLGRDAERARTSHRSWSVLEVHEVSPLSFPTPVRAPAPAQILREPKLWHDRFVELEGDWLTGFEASIIDGIWIDIYPDATIECEPKKTEPEDFWGSSKHRVRLEGFLRTEGEYGHLDTADAQLTATRVVFLDTPGCESPRSRASAE